MREKLVQALMDKRVELRQKGERSIKAYEVAFQDVIEEMFPASCWYDITDCNIFAHLMQYKDPTETVIEIIRRLK